MILINFAMNMKMLHDEVIPKRKLKKESDRQSGAVELISVNERETLIEQKRGLCVFNDSRIKVFQVDHFLSKVKRNTK